MSINTGSLSAGVQILANDGLLPSNLIAQQLKTATPGQLTQMEIANVESNVMSSLFNGGGSAADSVNLSGSVDLASSLFGGASTDSNSSATNDPLMQALEAAVTTSVSPSSVAATQSHTATATSGTSTPGSDTIGTLFSYLG